MRTTSRSPNSPARAPVGAVSGTGLSRNRPRPPPRRPAVVVRSRVVRRWTSGPVAVCRGVALGRPASRVRRTPAGRARVNRGVATRRPVVTVAGLSRPWTVRGVAVGVPSRRRVGVSRVRAVGRATTVAGARPAAKVVVTQVVTLAGKAVASLTGRVGGRRRATADTPVGRALVARAVPDGCLVRRTHGADMSAPWRWRLPSGRCPGGRCPSAPCEARVGVRRRPSRWRWSLPVRRRNRGRPATTAGPSPGCPARTRHW